MQQTSFSASGSQKCSQAEMLQLVEHPHQKRILCHCILHYFPCQYLASKYTLGHCTIILNVWHDNFYSQFKIHAGMIMID